MPESARAAWPSRHAPPPRWRPPRRPAAPTATTTPPSMPPPQHLPGHGLSGVAGHGHHPRRPRACWALVGSLLVLLAGTLAGNLAARQHAVVYGQLAPAPTSPPPRLGAEGTAAEMTGHGYRLQRPAGWQDCSADLSGRLGPIRPNLVLTGPVTGGFAATITVITTPPGARQTRLTQLPRLVAAELARAPKGRVLGTTRPATLAGEPAITYDFQFPTAGALLRGRQLVVDHGADRYFVTVEARAAGVTSTVDAFARLLRSWQWR